MSRKKDIMEIEIRLVKTTTKTILLIDYMRKQGDTIPQVDEFMNVHIDSNSRV